MESLQHQPEPGPGPRIGRSISLDQAAALLGVSRRTIYNRIRQGRLRTIRTLGGSQRVLLDSLRTPDDSGLTNQRRTRPAEDSKNNQANWRIGC